MATFEEYLEPYKISASGRPVFGKDEVELQFEKSHSIYFGDVKKLRRGECTLSNQRIFWRESDGGAIRHAIHLKHVAAVSTKSGFVGVSSPKVIMNLLPKQTVDKSAAASALAAPKLRKLGPPKPGYMKLSFHSGDRDEWLVKMKKALERKAWLQPEVEEKKEFTASSAGIRGILKDRKEREARTKKTMSEAFQDLEALMTHAKAMVAIANRLVRSKEAKDNEAEFDDMLQSMGISSPVTKAAAGSSYHSMLARQLCDYLLPGIERRGGMITLTDVYCVYNRARGSDLVSPDDIKAAAKMMRALRLPLKMRKFKETGLLVLELSAFSDEECAKRILKLIAENGPLDEMKYSRLAHISITLANQQLLDAEQHEHVCRDDSVTGVLFYANLFKDYVSSSA